MSETYKKITKDGSKVQVESAIRDGEGVKISTNYAKKSEIPDVSGKEDTSNKVTSISSSSTDTEYPSAKLLYDKITDVAEIAEGKTANYVISDATTGTNVVNNVFGLTSDSMMIPQEDRKIIDINGNEIPLSSLKTGDIISVVETDVPDRWVGSIRGGYVYVYKLETKLNIDSSPTSGSTNPVSSGGVYSALSGKADSSSIKDGTLTIQLNGNNVQTFTANQSTNATANIQALPNYSLSIGSTNGGNPRQVKFLSVNYTNYDGNNACFIKLGAMCSHGNGASYTFMDDIFIGVSSSGSVTCDVYKYFQQEVPLDGVTRNYGDVFYTIDTTNKVVDFYILLGQYSTANFTPYTKIGATTTTGITQLSGTPTYYSSGTKVWANGNSTIYARLSDVYPVGSIYMSVENNSPASWVGGTWVQLENRFLLGAGSSYTAGATGGEASHTLTETEMPSHRHSFSRPKSGDKWYSGGSAAWWASPLQTDYTGYTGGGQAHNNMPPYLVVYMWKRTA